MSPYIVNGEFNGYVLTRVRRDATYEKMGLQDVDVIESINVEKLSDADAAIRTLNSVRTNQPTMLTINRQGVFLKKEIQFH